jgi:hypothetical protein
MESQPTRKLLVTFLKRIENWVNAVALLITVLLGYRSLTTGNVNDYLQAVLAVLGLLALSQLAVGYSSILRDHEIKDLSASVKSLSEDKLSAELFFTTRKDLPPLDSRLYAAKHTIDALGLSLTTLAITRQGMLRDLRDAGIKLRLIVTNPNNESVQKAIAMKSLEIETAERHARLVRTVIENLGAIAGKSGDGTIEVRITDHVPFFSYVGTDTWAPEGSGRISIEYYLNKVPLQQNPIFILNAVTDQHWYEMFREQFEFYWNQARDPWTEQCDERPSSSKMSD